MKYTCPKLASQANGRAIGLQLPIQRPPPHITGWDGMSKWWQTVSKLCHFPKATLPVDLRRQTLTTSHCKIILVNTWVGWTFSIKRASNEQYREVQQEDSWRSSFYKAGCTKENSSKWCEEFICVHRAHPQDGYESLNLLFSSFIQEAWVIQVKECVGGCVHTHTSCAPFRFLMSSEKCLRNPTEWLSSLYPQMMTELGSLQNLLYTLFYFVLVMQDLREISQC